MRLEGRAKALEVIVGESDHWHGKPLYAAIVERARALGMAGATATHGIMGFGHNSRIHTSSILRLSEDLPVTITIVDSAELVAKLLGELDEMLGDGLAMTWDVTVERYSPKA